MLVTILCLFSYFILFNRLSPGFPCFLPRETKKLYINGGAASEIVIEGGTFSGNEALESGGAIAVWGSPGLVTITGGTFEHNKAM